jgi:hypothetical protein
MYTGLEPIINSGTATDVIFNLPAAASVATLGDDGTSGNGMSRLSSAPATVELTDFANPTGSLTINRGNAGDALKVNALPDFNASLTIGSAGGEFSTLIFAGGVALAANKSLAAHASSTISLSAAASDLSVSGTGALAFTTARDISLVTGSSVTTVNGNLTLLANQQVSPSTGNFVGIDVNGLIQSTGTGAVTVKGRGGNGAGGQYGVSLSFNGDGDIIGGTTGALLVEGTGGPGTSSGNYGVEIRGPNAPSITSAGANVTVTGVGGGSGSTAKQPGSGSRSECHH